MIDNTSLLKARIKMLKNKKQTLPLGKLVKFLKFLYLSLRKKKKKFNKSKGIYTNISFI